MKVNRVIRTLVTSDFLLISGFAIFGPIFAIFITQKIEGGTLEIIGFTAAIFQITKSSLQIPIANYLDKNHGEKDDFYSLIIGSFLIALVPFLYIFASKPIHLYLINVIYGMGAAFAIPPWNAIFTRHIDKMHESTDWAVESVSIGIGAASAAALGGILAEKFGFKVVFLVAGAAAIAGAITLIKIYSELREKVGQGQVFPKPDKKHH
ncbi:MAG: MFS transporter [Parcubacteria group bacterium]|nr:MFS transporter [Parcubacteria group bacterium]